MLASFSVVALIAAGIGVVTGALALITLAMVVVVLRDLPLSAEFRPDCVIRRSPLRRVEIAWSDVTRLTRSRTGVAGTRPEARSGGLVAVRNGRRYLLVDRAESEIEFEMVVRVLGDWADALLDQDAIRPLAGRSPTWTYRRRHWRPGSNGEWRT